MKILSLLTTKEKVARLIKNLVFKKKKKKNKTKNVIMVKLQIYTSKNLYFVSIILNIFKKS